MAKFLGKQLQEIDPRPPVHDYKEILAINLGAVDLERLRRQKHGLGSELTKLRQRAFVELAKIFWSFKDGMKADFPMAEVKAAVNASSDPWLTLVESLEGIISEYADQTEFEANMREDLDIPLRIADGTMRVRAAGDLSRPQEAHEHFFQELTTGLVLWSQFIELVHRVYEQQFGVKMPAEALIRTLKSNIFLNIAISLGRSSALAERAFFLKVKKKDGKLDRVCINTQKFELLERNGVFIPRMKDDLEEEVGDLFYEKFRQLGLKSTCPASQVEGEDGLIIKEFANWIVELFCEIYVPRVCGKA